MVGPRASSYAATYSRAAIGFSSASCPPNVNVRARTPEPTPSPSSTSATSEKYGTFARRLDSLSYGISGRTSRATRSTGMPEIATSRRPVCSPPTTYIPSANS
jgi:hypothetical protein